MIIINYVERIPSEKKKKEYGLLMLQINVLVNLNDKIKTAAG